MAQSKIGIIDDGGDPGNGQIDKPGLPINKPPQNPPKTTLRGTATATIVAVDNAISPRYATIAIKNKTPFESGYIVPPGSGPFAAGGTTGYHFFYNNASGVGGSLVRVDLDSREILSFTGDVSTSAPTSYYRAITDHIHSGSLNPDGFTNPQPVDLSASQTQNLLPYSQNTPVIQSVINVNGKLLATQFSAGVQNMDGSFSNVDGASSNATFNTASGQTITSKAIIAKGATGASSGLIIGNATNGYAVIFGTSSANLVRITAGAQVNLLTFAMTDDTNYHSFVVSVALGSGSNVIEGYIDSHYFTTTTDATPPVITNPSPITVLTSGNTGKLQDFEVYLGNDPFSTLPGQVKGVVNSSGQLLVTMFPGAVQNLDNSISLPGGGPTATVPTFRTGTGSTTSVKAVMIAGSTVGYVLVGNVTNGYGLAFDNTNQVYLFKQSGGAGSIIGTVLAQTLDNAYHHYSITVAVSAGVVTVSAMFDSTPLVTYVDSSPAPIANPTSILVSVAGTTPGKIQDFTVESGGFPILRLPYPYVTPSYSAYGSVTLPAGSYVTGSSAYGATLGFTTSISPDPSTWADHAEIRAVPSGTTWNSTTCAGDTVATIRSADLKGPSTAYSIVLNQSMPVGKAYDLRLVIFDHKGIPYDGGGAIIATTVAQNLASTVMQSMPSGVKSAGPTIVSAGVPTRTVSKGTNHKVTLPITIGSTTNNGTTDYFGSKPGWLAGITIVMRNNTDTDYSNETDWLFEQWTNNGTGTLTATITQFGPLGNNIDFGIYYTDQTGVKSAIVYPTNWLGVADPNGDLVDPADGGAIRPIKMGWNVRNVISTGGGLNVSPTGGTSGNLPFANTDLGIQKISAGNLIGITVDSATGRYIIPNTDYGAPTQQTYTLGVGSNLIHTLEATFQRASGDSASVLGFQLFTDYASGAWSNGYLVQWGGGEGPNMHLYYKSAGTYTGIAVGATIAHDYNPHTIKVVVSQPTAGTLSFSVYMDGVACLSNVTTTTAFTSGRHALSTRNGGAITYVDPNSLSITVGTDAYEESHSAYQGVIDRNATVDVSKARTATIMPYWNHDSNFRNRISPTGGLDISSTPGTVAGLLPYGNNTQAIQNKTSLHYSVVGQMPYVDSSNVLHFPSYVHVFRPADNSYSFISAGSTVSIPTGNGSNAYGSVFLVWNQNGAGTLLYVSYVSTGVAGTGYGATAQSAAYEILGGVNSVNSPSSFSPLFDNSNLAAATHNVITDNGDSTGYVNVDRAHPSKTLPFISNSPTVKSKQGATIYSLGKMPYVTTGGVLTFPNAVVVMRGDGTYTVVAAGTTLTLSATSSLIYVTYTGTGANGTVGSVQFNGAISTYSQSTSYEVLGFTYGNIEFYPAGWVNSSGVAAAQDAVLHNGDGTGTLKIDTNAGTRILARANTHSDFTSTIATGGGLSSSVAISKLIYNSVAYSTDMVLNVVIGAGPNYPVSVYISNQVGGNGTPAMQLPSAPTTNVLMTAFGTLASPIALPAPLTTSTTSDTLYMIASYSPGSTAGRTDAYSNNVFNAGGTNGGPWTIYVQKNAQFNAYVVEPLFADGFAISFTTASGGTFVGGAGGGGGHSGGGGARWK